MNQGSVNRDRENYRCGTIAIVGRPNVGKSTLINALVGQKISITSRKAQTTQHRIIGIRTLSDVQYIFVDTPGFQTRYGGMFNRSLNRAVKATLSTVDVVLFVVEAGYFNADDQKVLKLIADACSAYSADSDPNVTSSIGTTTLLIANKLDRIGDKARLPPFLQQMGKLRVGSRDFCAIVPLSAKRADDVHRLLRLLKSYLPKCTPLYERAALTDRSERFLAAELLREKVFRLTGDELPYTSAVVIDKFEQTGRLRRIFATILIERKNHKAIIIGTQGSKLKQISTDARLDMEKCFGGPVYLEVWVKVNKDGRQKEPFNEK